VKEPAFQEEVAEPFGTLVAGVDGLRPAGEAGSPPRPFSGQLSVLALDGLREEPGLAAQLARLRSRGGSCRPLVDCFECCSEAPLPDHQIRAVLRATLGTAAVCEDMEEAEAVALQEQCDVYCCGGARMVEYCPHTVPSLLWKQWAGERVIVSL